MLQHYEPPTVAIRRLGSTDVICTSDGGAIQWNGAWNIGEWAEPQGGDVE